LFGVGFLPDTFPEFVQVRLLMKTDIHGHPFQRDAPS
jgi:hypothetical protein